MESNGKSVTLEGGGWTIRRADLLGRAGDQRAASFYQLIHQGTKLVPCDFIGFAQSLNPIGEHHDL
jgi:glucose-6-phosphate isomerase